MADSKRANAGGKGGSGSPAVQSNHIEALPKAIGAKLKIVTHSQQTYEGTLFTADPLLNIVAINTSSAANAQSGDYHVLPASNISSFQILDSAPGEVSFSSAQPAIGPIDARQLQKREETRVAQLKEQEENRGKGVSKEGQALYDALKRIGQQVRWHGQQIIVNDIAIISAPYSDVKGSGEKPAELQRIKKIVEDQRRKIKEKEDKDRKTATTTGPRKGG